MISIEQVMRGAMRYIDSDILPHLDSTRRFAVALYVNLASNQIKLKASELLQHPAVKMLGLSEGCMVDVDKLHVAAIEQLAHDDRLEVTLPVVGQMVFHRTDIESLYRAIIDS